MPGECDGFQVNQEFAAFPLSGPGGQIAVVPVSLNYFSLTVSLKFN